MQWGCVNSSLGAEPGVSWKLGKHLRVLEEAVFMFGDPKQRRQEHGAGVQAQPGRALHHVNAAGTAVLSQLVVPWAEDRHRRVDLRGGCQLGAWQRQHGQRD